MKVSLVEITFVAAAICPLVNSDSLNMVVLPLARVLGPILPKELAQAAFISSIEHPLIF
jgi:hypothetical protein